jgi:hypothetical protein
MASHMELGIEGLMFLALPWITPLLLIPHHLLKSSKMEQTEMLEIDFKNLLSAVSSLIGLSSFNMIKCYCPTPIVQRDSNSDFLTARSI